MKNEYRINSFKDLAEIKNFRSDALETIEERLRTASNGNDFLLTDLQLKAFNQQGFWSSDEGGNNSHIIIKGATSSGKTLVSELAILDAIRNGKKSIVLVPLKAMVRERRDLFRRDFDKTGTTEIYASSSDFLDHDGDIIDGQYSVAVIVYEKFFAMLAQSSGNMLNGCSLIVVDELQMLSNEGRGPKLEISLQKVLHDNEAYDRFIRIMCLTTCDCSIDYISKWLSSSNGKDPIIIESTKRPVGLDEYVICANGEWRMKHVSGERDSVQEEITEKKGSIEVTGIGGEGTSHLRGNSEKWKRDLLKSLLKSIHDTQPNSKVLVFVNGRNKAKVVAEYISNQEELTEFVPLNADMLSELDKFDSDDYQNVLKNSLLPRKIGFHNAAMSTALREFIEDKFNEKDTLSIVTATETLTIGMNMPVDVMILYDMSVPRNYNNSVNLTTQEYKNFAGRAGRLGICNQIGKSFIFAKDEQRMKEYWNKYVNCTSSEIESALTHTSVERQAPYYLSLLEDNGGYRDLSKGFSKRDLEKLHNDSFSKICGGKQLDMAEMIKYFLKVDLCYEVDVDEDEIFDEPYQKYRLTAFGRLMAPYALSLQSCNMIKRVFMSGGYIRVKDQKTNELKWSEMLKDGGGGLPETVTATEIENDKYLLDILYAICRTPEIVNLSQLKLPDETNPDRSRRALNRIDEKLRELVCPQGESKAKCVLWYKSPLSLFIDGIVKDEREQKEPLMRAIILWYWTKGESINSIKRNTGFDEFTSIVSGDVSRLAEAVSYQIEAIYRCQGGYKGKSNFAEKALTPLYVLSTRVKYGMPRNLVIIANRQIHGLDRKTILQIGRTAADKGYDSPAQFIKNAPAAEIDGIISESIRKELLSSIAEIYLRDAFESLMEELNVKSRIISDNERQGLDELYNLSAESIDKSLLLSSLAKLFATDELIAAGDYNPDDMFYSSNIKMSLIQNGTIARLTIPKDDKNYEYLISIYHGNNSDMQAFNSLIKANPEAKAIMLFLSDSDMKEHMKHDSYDRWILISNNQEGNSLNRLVDRINAAMSASTFSQVLAQDIALSDRNARILSCFLEDLIGEFLNVGLKQLYPLLENYDEGVIVSLSKRFEGQNQIRILYDQRIGLESTAFEQLLKYLDYKKIPYRLLTWGSNLEKETVNETAGDYCVLFVNGDSVNNSRSLTGFISKIKNTLYRNTLGLFVSEHQYMQWDIREKSHLRYKVLSKINNDFTNIDTLYHGEIPEGNYDFIIGVSYAHESNAGYERDDVKQLKKIIHELNGIYGESSVLFDANPGCSWLFDGKGAKKETLELYRKCKYFIILDDSFYDGSYHCKAEMDVIMDEMEKDTDLKEKRLIYLHPTDQNHTKHFNSEVDFSTPMYYTDKNTMEIVDIIKKQLLSLGVDARV